jgi:hypothetical protein
MSKHHHLQSIAEQIANKGHGSPPFHYSKNSYQAHELLKSEDIQPNAPVDNNSIQLRALQIHDEKGGTAMENWLEAEQILKAIDQNSSRYINEGNPNIQK